jgi:hypothetical protein
MEAEPLLTLFLCSLKWLAGGGCCKAKAGERVRMPFMPAHNVQYWPLDEVRDEAKDRQLFKQVAAARRMRLIGLELRRLTARKALKRLKAMVARWKTLPCGKEARDERKRWLKASSSLQGKLKVSDGKELIDEEEWVEG